MVRSVSFRFKLYIRKIVSFINMSAGVYRDVPFGIVVIQKATAKCCPQRIINRDLWYKTSILALTYMAYTCYHLTRKPISVVKSVLHQNCSNLIPPPDIHINPINNATWCDWAPFDGSDGDATALLGTLDSAFLFAYAIAMFASGFVAERVNLRYFLSIGMIFSGIFSYMFGIAKIYDIHSMGYFVFVQAAAGIMQTTGWPGVVTVVGKWFGKGKRGLIFGIWNSHTSIGNILGALIAAQFLDTDWSLSFMVPGIIMAAAGMIIFLFMVEDPANVYCLTPGAPPGANNTIRRRRAAYSGHASDDQSEFDEESQVLVGDQENNACYRSNRMDINGDDPALASSLSTSTRHPNSPNENTNLLSTGGVLTSPSTSVTMGTSLQSSSDLDKKAVGFIGALKIPGVVEFSLCLFFAKLVSYTFLYWLPIYIKSSALLSPTLSAKMSTLFDVGGIFGAILAGLLTDCSGMPACTCAVMLFLAAPMMMVYENFGSINAATNICLLIIVGCLVNGPYALITTAVSAELGTHHSLEGNSRALATVTAIIDGTGSIGAAIGPLLAAFVSSQGWSKVFYMLICCDIVAMILLLRLVKQEISRCRQHRSGPIE